MKPKDFLFDYMWRNFPRECDPPPAERIWRFLELLQQEGQNFNLTAIHDMAEALYRLIVDSLAPLAAPDCPLDREKPLRVLDVGSGNGTPGLAAAVVMPHWRVALLESNHKKCDFIRRAAEAMRAENVEVFCGRAENLAREPLHREGYDFVMARALAILPTALELCVPFVAPDGWFLAYKGYDCEKELAVSRKAFDLLGSRLAAAPPYAVDGTTLIHHAVWVQKVARTKNLYPRQDGMPKKRPLWEQRG